MYETFFGLKQKPFRLTSDPAFLFLTPQHREALAGLAYSILGRKGMVVFTGEAGTGKTTLTLKVIQQLPPNRLRSSIILNPTLTPSEFLEMMFLNLGFHNVPASKAQRLWTLQKLLLENRSADKVIALIVDEAHTLSHETLEEIRLLSNFEYGGEKLLQILLIGQPELATVLNDPSLIQMKQRVGLRLSLKPLASHEILDYVAWRWKVAGGTTEPPFKRDAITAVGEYSGGVPRMINTICDNALMLALGEDRRSVELQHVANAARDLDLTLRVTLPEPVLAIPVRPDEAAVPLEQSFAPAHRSSALLRWARKLTPLNGTDRA